MRFTGLLALLLAVGVLPTTQSNAAFVIDDFSVASTVGSGRVDLGNGVERSIQRIGDPSVTGSASGGSFSASSATPASNVSAGITLRYFFDPAVFSAFGKESTLSLASFSNNGPSDVVITAQKGGGIEETFVVNPGGALSPAEFLFTDSNSWGSQFRIRIQTVDPGSEIDFSGVGPLSISAVPEPASLGLLACALVGGGGVAARRRRRGKSTAVAG